MSKSDTDQRSEFVPQRKRIAMGEKLNGTSLKGHGSSKPRGGLSQAPSKKSK